MSQARIFNDDAIKAMNAILRKLPGLGPAEISYLINRLSAMKRDVAPPAD